MNLRCELSYFFLLFSENLFVVRGDFEGLQFSHDVLFVERLVFTLHRFVVDQQPRVFYERDRSCAIVSQERLPFSRSCCKRCV
jgi:hypothetical protein